MDGQQFMCSECGRPVEHTDDGLVPTMRAFRHSDASDAYACSNARGDMVWTAVPVAVMCQWCGEPGTNVDPIEMTDVAPPVDGFARSVIHAHRRCADEAAESLVM